MAIVMPTPISSLKKNWLKERIAEGHVFRKLDEKGKVFIEYAPLETAWVPVHGDNYLYIYCLWVSGSFKGKGYAKSLIEYCINDAKEKGQDLITVCSACHHVIKRVNDDMANVEDIQTKVNNYMALSEPYLGETKVLHYLEVLRDVVGFDKIKEKVVNPLKGRKIGAYYGCMLLRPSTTMQFDDPENPTIIEDFIKALGATPVVYPMRNECCGGYISLKEKKMASNMVDQIMASASYKGAEELITACPLCMYNLRNNGTKEGLPVTYFTELLAEALGIKEEVQA